MDRPLSRGDDREDNLLSDWLEEYPYGMTKLVLRWSADAIREAFNAAGAEEVSMLPG